MKKRIKMKPILKLSNVMQPLVFFCSSAPYVDINKCFRHHWDWKISFKKNEPEPLTLDNIKDRCFETIINEIYKDYHPTVLKGYD